MSDNNPFETPLEAEMPGGVTTSNPFEHAFTDEPQQTAPQNPQGAIGYGQGIWDTTIAPIKNLVGEMKDNISHRFDPSYGAEAAAINQQGEDYKRKTYAEAGQHLKNGEFTAAAGSLLSLLGGGPTDKSDPVYKIVSGLIDAHREQASKTVKDFKEGRYSEAAGHGLATVIPALGPAASKAGEDIGNGDIAYGLGEATGLIGSILGPGFAKKGLGKIAEAVTPSTEVIAGEPIPVRSSLAKLSGAESQEAFDRAQTNPAGRRAVANVASDVAGAEAPGAISVEDPLGIRQAAEAPKLRAKSGWDKVDAATNGAFSDAQQAALDSADDFTAVGKKQFREANAKVEQLIDQNASQLPEGTTAKSLKTDYRVYINMQKAAKVLDTAFEPSPGTVDGGYVAANRLRSKIADLRQNGVLKNAGFTPSHIDSIEQIAVRMQQGGEYARISKIATGIAAELGIHTIGAIATAKIGAPLLAVRYLVGKALTSQAVATSLLRGLKIGTSPAVATSEVMRALSASGNISSVKTPPTPATVNTVLAGNQ